MKTLKKYKNVEPIIKIAFGKLDFSRVRTFCLGVIALLV